MKLTPGKQGDATVFSEALDAVPTNCPVQRAITDQAFDSVAIRSTLSDRIVQAVIPSICRQRGLFNARS